MMRKLMLLAAAAFTLLSCQAGENSPHRYALVYGVSRYLSSVPAGTSPNLEYAAADADSAAGMLTAGGFDALTERTSDFSGGVYVNGVSTPGGGPTKANIASDLASLAGTIGSEDLLVFYYSGHGVQYPDSQGRTKEWIAPLGTLIASATIDWNAAINEDELSAMLSAVPSERKVVILDSCNSGGFVGDPLEVDRTPASYGQVLLTLSPSVIAAAISNYFNFPSMMEGISPYGNALVISASGRDESSWEASELQHGVMTYYFLQARENGDLNGDGIVTAVEVFSLIKAGIDTNWNAAVSDDEKFEPHVSGGPVDYVLF